MDIHIFVVAVYAIDLYESYRPRLRQTKQNHISTRPKKVLILRQIVDVCIIKKPVFVKITLASTGVFGDNYLFFLEL